MKDNTHTHTDTRTQRNSILCFKTVWVKSWSYIWKCVSLYYFVFVCVLALLLFLLPSLLKYFMPPPPLWSTPAGLPDQEEPRSLLAGRRPSPLSPPARRYRPRSNKVTTKRGVLTSHIPRVVQGGWGMSLIMQPTGNKTYRELYKTKNRKKTSKISQHEASAVPLCGALQDFFHVFKCRFFFCSLQIKIYEPCHQLEKEPYSIKCQTTSLQWSKPTIINTTLSCCS